MKVALLHDWLTGMRGGERCLEAFLSLYPTADVFTLFHIPGSTSALIDARVKGVSTGSRLPRVEKYYRTLLPLYPQFARQFDLSGYDLVISLSHAAVKNARIPEGVPHFCYCFTPMRYIWDEVESYFGKKRYLLWPLIHQLRQWDKEGSKGVHHFVAISKFIASRIRCYYGRPSSIVYPPVDTSWITPCNEGERGEAFLFAGALVPYKRAELVVAACTAMGEKLWVIGKGPQEAYLKSIAGPTVEFLGHVSDAELAERYRRCRALIFPAKEDFGLIPVECMAAGRPVIGLSWGGVGESVQGVLAGQALPSKATGVFIPFRERVGMEEVLHALYYFQAHEEEFFASACREQAQKFSPLHFQTSWHSVVQHQTGAAVTGDSPHHDGMTQKNGNEAVGNVC